MFSDLSQQEFESKYLTKIHPHTNKHGQKVDVKTPLDVNAGLVDWSGVYTTPVKNQGQCGRYNI